ncbi:hypothetical protein [Arthrobacter sp. CG_A4]|uniref:hypothetical protein n=1 Tax=Arthrobacter sp. CG_A4 TaxID=3071706 RepID=UPI002E017871|nr:hypothetical protein [Arthrobacter sp. CG_A4]
MTEIPDKDETVPVDKEAKESFSGEPGTKIDPDFVPPDTETPKEKRARENPEQTGS